MRIDQFADLLDLMSLGLSSGMVLDEACAQAIRSLSDVRLEKHLNSRGVFGVFESLIKDSRDPRFLSIVAIIMEAHKSGAPIQELLSQQAEFLREEYLWMIEQKAQTLGVRLLFPIMLFIFPSVFILLMGSLYLQFRGQGLFF